MKNSTIIYISREALIQRFNLVAFPKNYIISHHCNMGITFGELVAKPTHLSRFFVNKDKWEKTILILISQKEGKMTKCVFCEGSGILDCSICYGRCAETGIDNCFYCNWDGPKECPVCDGIGEVQYQHCDDEYFYIDPYYQMNNGALVFPSY